MHHVASSDAPAMPLFSNQSDPVLLDRKWLILIYTDTLILWYTNIIHKNLPIISIHISAFASLFAKMETKTLACGFK